MSAPLPIVSKYRSGQVQSAHYMVFDRASPFVHQGGGFFTPQELVLSAPQLSPNFHAPFLQPPDRSCDEFFFTSANLEVYTVGMDLTMLRSSVKAQGWQIWSVLFIN